MIGTVVAIAVAVSIGGVGVRDTPAVKVTWELNPPDRAALGRCFITSTHFLTDASMEFTIKTLENAGWKGDDVIALADPDPEEVRKLLPNQVELVLDEEFGYNDPSKKYTVVKFVNRYSGGGIQMKKLSGSALESVSASLRMRVRAKRQEEAPAQEEHPLGEDDFDFGENEPPAD